MKKDPFLSKIMNIINTTITFILCIALYGIIVPNPNIILEANEPITFSFILGIGLGLYLVFALCELVKPTDIANKMISRFSNRLNSSGSKKT